MTEDPFHTQSDIYDALIDWDKRLANEGPLFRAFFDEVGARRVLDAACGSGRHAAMFHEWGLAVEGADLSEAMVAESRARFGESEDLRWVVRSFDQPCDRPGSFDAVICIGNSLALANEPTVQEGAISAMLSALRPGGLCIVHVLNLWRIAEGASIWQKCKRTVVKDEDHVLLKKIHRVGDHAHIDFVDLKLTPKGVGPSYTQTTFAGIEAGDLERAARRAGGTNIRFVGDYQQSPYQREQSVDLIMICHHQSGVMSLAVTGKHEKTHSPD